MWRQGDPREMGKLKGQTIVIWTGHEATAAVVETHHGYHIELCSPVPGRTKREASYIDIDGIWPAEWRWAWPPEAS